MKIFLSTFLLIFAAKSSFTAEVKAVYEVEDKGLVIFTYNKENTLSCNVTGVTEKPLMEWQKDGNSVNTVDGLKDRISTPEASAIAGGGYSFHLKIRATQYTDAGNFSCIARQAGAELGKADIQFVAKVAVRIKLSNINVVEEEKLKIECQALGNPEIKWRVNTTRVESEFESGDDAKSSNITIENFKDENGLEIENGALIISAVNKDDRGNYSCIGVNRYSEKEESETSTYVRVKDKYAALWPFLGICAEVVVLCAIIIIYEKKRNKTELEESDTDQSPDQKNTPDHGKQANLRHRQ